MKKIGYVVVFLSLMILLAGCREKPVVEPEGDYDLYYLNQSETGLEKAAYSAQGTTVKELISEFLEALKTPEDDKQLFSLFGDGVEIEKYQYEARNIELYMGSGYALLSNTKEVLVRAGLVRTLVQIDGVDSVSFFVNGQPLCNSKGEMIGKLNAASFIENSGREINSYKNKTILMYFTNEEGTELVEESRKLYYNSSASLEQVVVEQLLIGPKSAGHFPTLPSGAKIMSVTVVDRICYVNFDKTFSEDALNVQEQIPIYSIVNTLIENCSVNKVQISIDGESDLIFRESMKLSELYSMNRDLVQMHIE